MTLDVTIRRVWPYYEADGQTLKYATVIARDAVGLKEHVCITFDAWMASRCDQLAPTSRPRPVVTLTWDHRKRITSVQEPEAKAS